MYARTSFASSPRSHQKPRGLSRRKTLQFGAGVEVLADLLCSPSEFPFLDRLSDALGVRVVVRGQWHEQGDDALSSHPPPFPVT